MYDIIIIGAGVSGCAIARELSRYQLKICVLEREADVCEGASKANSGIVHAGYDAVEGSLKARLNVRGNHLMESLCKDLDIPFERNGSLVICHEEASLPKLQELYDRGLSNGVQGLQLLTRKEVLTMEPNITDNVVGALYASSAGIVDPFLLNIALAENANDNGVDFRFQAEVTGIHYHNTEEVYDLIVNHEEMLRSKIVINASGVYGDYVYQLLFNPYDNIHEDPINRTLTSVNNPYHITARRGEYVLLDQTAGNHVKSTIFPLPTTVGKGILVAPTVHRNLLVGPTAHDIQDKEETITTAIGLQEIREKASLYVTNVPLDKVITSFSGLRAHEEHGEFVIRMEQDYPGFFNCIGIASPGLTSAPAIGEIVSDLVMHYLSKTNEAPVLKEDFIINRIGTVHPPFLDEKERQTWIQKYPAYGNIICRCEMISEGEILDAIHRPLGATTLDGLKRRVRTGSGRCQGGFCTPRLIAILARELGVSPKEITKCGGGSIILGDLKR